LMALLTAVCTWSCTSSQDVEKEEKRELYALTALLTAVCT